MDGKLLACARNRLSDRVKRNESELFARKKNAYSKVPELKEIDVQLRGLAARAAMTALQHRPDAPAAIDAFAEKSMELQVRRRLLLRGAGLPEDYIDEIYTCARCRDTGYVDGKMCSCFAELYRDEARKSLSDLLNMGEADFARFDLSYYSDQADQNVGVSPRKRMRVIYDYCRLYAQKFSLGADNLLLQGGTGLGKTYLSSCIARTVAEKGYSVVYQTTVSCISDFETQKFSGGGEDRERACEQVKRYLGCDLMILDDLGTEMSGGYAPTALYTLINTRLASGKTTIISTNLTDAELSRKYPEQIVSRLEGEYFNLRFLGSDIRKIKKARTLGL